MLTLAWTYLLASRGYPPAYLDRVLALLPHRPLRRALTRADVVLASPPYLIPWLRRLMPAGVPLVLDEHSIEMDMYRDYGGPFGRRIASEVARVEKAAVRSSDLCLVNCDDDGERVLALGGKEIALVPNGVDTDRFRPPRDGERVRLRAELGLGQSDKIAVFVGSGHPPNVEAVKALENHAAAFNSAGLQVVVVGRCGRAGREVPGVRCVGEVADPAEWLRAADLALCPLLAGSGTSLKTMEFLATGIPLLTTIVGIRGLDVTAEHAVICEVGEMPGLAAALLADPSAVSRLGAAARELAIKRYTWAAAGLSADSALSALIRT